MEATPETRWSARTGRGTRTHTRIAADVTNIQYSRFMFVEYRYGVPTVSGTDTGQPLLHSWLPVGCGLCARPNRATASLHTGRTEVSPQRF